ncbi:excalibur calcium-binding domain-containing protein [Sphingomonas aurantiaca]
MGGGCNDARPAGPYLYRGEPGYRVGMDGDEDGIAREGWSETMGR